MPKIAGGKAQKVFIESDEEMPDNLYPVQLSVKMPYHRALAIIGVMVAQLEYTDEVEIILYGDWEDGQ